jgi:hypothetical protein
MMHGSTNIKKPWTKQDIISAGRERKRICLCTKKDVTPAGHGIKPLCAWEKKILYLLVVDVIRYDLFLHEVKAINRGRKRICPNQELDLVTAVLAGFASA